MERCERVLVMFGRNVRELREKRGYSQSRLSNAAGIPLPLVQAIESGLYDAELSAAEDLASALGVHPACLIKASDPCVMPPARLQVVRVRKNNRMAAGKDIYCWENGAATPPAREGSAV